MDEEGRRERIIRLREQRQRAEERIKAQNDAVPSPSPPADPAPDFAAVSDDESAGGDSPLVEDVHGESEGDGWDDHPIFDANPGAEAPVEPDSGPILVPTDDTSEAPTPPREPTPRPRRSVRRQNRERERPRWVRDENDRLRRVNTSGYADLSPSEKAALSHAEKSQFACSLSGKRSPQASLQARRKRTRRQRQRELRELGDQQLLRAQLVPDTFWTPTQLFRNYIAAEDNSTAAEIPPSDSAAPSIEDILRSPLGKFIKFAAQENEYDGTTRDLIVKWVHPLFLKAKSAASKEDNPNFWQAMNGPFADEFHKAAVKELETLESMDAWDIVDETPDMNVIDSTWAFKIKRFPDGLIKKFKARFCARGDQQIEGVDFFETYAPVVQWTTVRLMLILEVLLALVSKQGDVTAAFLHAKLGEDEKVHIRMPMGFRKKGKVLRLKRTLYGLRQSPRAFWKYLVEKMALSGLEQSELDPCLFIGPKVIAIAYVDDILFWARDEADIHDVAMKLREVGVDLEQEDDAAGFLGVRMERDAKTGLLEMKQTGLIDRVVEAMGLDIGLIKSKWTPAAGEPLVRDDDGEAAHGEFNYASVVGMLLYLSGHSRPDIAYAVNCAARYMFCPKRSHEEALKRIGRYLKATRTRGLVINPSSDKLKIDCYPDADFAGMYGYEKPDDPSCVKSRTGFIINVADCPVLWQSKLQTETALSTMQAEIIALAHSCRELFPVMDMVHSLGPAVGLEVEQTSMHVSIHEDNSGALILADMIPPEYTPRSKWYHTKTIWFREEIKRRAISLLKIDTAEQLGDIFTKGLARPIFEHLRKKIMGW